jgi:replicative DNA helicase
MEEKILPLTENIKEVEEALLGALILDEEVILKVIDILKPEDFLFPEHRAIYEAVCELFERRISIDFVTLTTRLREKNLLEKIGGQEKILYLIHKAPTLTNALSYARIIKTNKAKLDLLELSNKIKDIIQNPNYDAEKLIDEVEKNIFKIADRVYPYEFSPISSLIDENVKRIEDLQTGKIIRGIPTGFEKLDEYLGGFQKSDLIILASRPSQGKTALALSIARNVAVREKIPVGIFSLEMSKDQIIDRLLASEAGVSLWKLRTGRLTSDGEVDELALVYEAAERLKKSPIFIDDTPSLTNLQIRTMSRKLKHEIGELGILIIDYLQLVKGSKNYESRVQEVTEISKSLKELARELEVPVIAISQLSREPEKRISSIPKLSDLRESGCLTGDTLILDAESGRYIPIKEIAEKNLKIKVLTINNEGKIEIKKLVKAFYSGRKMTYLLKTKTGREIKASSNHPFYTPYGWKALEELKRGERIALPLKIFIENPKNVLKDEEIIFLAHMIGDGCYVKNQPLHYTNSDFSLILLMAKLANELFNIKARIVKQKNWWHVYFPSTYHLAKNKHHPIVIWLRNLGLDFSRSYEKKIPDKVFELHEDKIALFLRHLWSTDGNISVKKLKGRKDSLQIYYSTTSKILAQQVQSLLLRLEIQSYLKVTKKSNYRENYWVILYGKENLKKFLTKIGIEGGRKEKIAKYLRLIEKIKPHYNNDLFDKDVWRLIIDPIRKEKKMSWREFCKGINTSYCGSTLLKTRISKERMLKIAKVLDDQRLERLVQNDIFWDEVIEIVPLKVEDVYDATIEENHNFLANDIFVHNSLEQDADVVLFIHRPKDAGTTLPSNQVQIIIAKHRNGPIGVVDLFFDPETVSFYEIENTFQEIEFY